VTKRPTVRIRMYNVGFGDCFLVTIPAKDRPRLILIDCGTHPASTGKYRAERDAVPLLLQDLKEEYGALRLDVVVASHRHKDHVSGFANKEFHKVEVGEVWLPWTENRDDKTATNLRERMGLVTEQLDTARAVAFNLDSEAVEAAAAVIDNNFALRNQAAMDMLWDGFGGDPKHWYVSAPAEPQTTAVLPGVKIHVLGPSKDEATIRDLEPPAEETFAHFASMGADVENGPQPFDEGWSIQAEQFAFSALRVSEETQARIRRLAEEDLLAAAATLESSINGTSLMFMLEVGGLFLFFPGDAQWGTWKAVLDDPASRDLLKRASFYKVGHHGSHNATPSRFVDEVMSSKAWAAISVADVKRWPSIPLGELVERIRKRKVNLVQSDLPPAADSVPNVTVRDDRSVDFTFELPEMPMA
jgi:beta-lactamase superfamily II metal-dependent hydrolase